MQRACGSTHYTAGVLAFAFHLPFHLVHVFPGEGHQAVSPLSHADLRQNPLPNPESSQSGVCPHLEAVTWIFQGTSYLFVPHKNWKPDFVSEAKVNDAFLPSASKMKVFLRMGTGSLYWDKASVPQFMQ